MLWLFGDTFIATSAAHMRRESRMVRNSVAIQQGYDPSTAKIRFYWNSHDQAPGAFFPDDGNEWYWPGHGILVGGRLLIFLQKIHRAEGSLGFAAFAWTAVAIDNPDEPPDRWHLHWLAVPPNEFKVVIGSASVLRSGDYVLAYGAAEPGPNHDVFLVRWPVAVVARGDLSGPEWWDSASRQWIPQRGLRHRPGPVFTQGQTEFTVHHDSRRNRFVEIQTRGFGGADLAFRSAAELTGPWSALQGFHRPAEAARPGVLIYAGRAHPELKGADLVVTYATNSDWERCLDDPGLYFPRFLKLTIAQDSSGRPGR